MTIFQKIRGRKKVKRIVFSYIFLQGPFLKIFFEWYEKRNWHRMWSYSSSNQNWEPIQITKIFPKDKSWVSPYSQFDYDYTLFDPNAFVDKLPCLLHSDNPFSFRTIPLSHTSHRRLLGHSELEQMALGTKFFANFIKRASFHDLPAKCRISLMKIESWKKYVESSKGKSVFVSTDSSKSWQP